MSAATLGVSVKDFQSFSFIGRSAVELKFLVQKIFFFPLRLDRLERFGMCQPGHTRHHEHFYSLRIHVAYHDGY